jgi:uncharacterized protein
MSKSFLFPFLISSFFVIILSIPYHSAAQKKKKKQSDKISLLLIDGQSKYHPNWMEWTPVLLKQLDDSGLFQLDVATSPQKGESLDKFNPKFKKYDVVVSLYDGDKWSQRAKRNLEKYVADGGGLVVVHAANNAFPDWEAYNIMIGLGGWSDRDQTAGPYIYYDNKNEIIVDTTPGVAGHHGPKHQYIVETRASDHPIMKDIPPRWLHTEDELYDRLRGPAANMTILATAFSSEKYDGTERNEPILITVKYGGGRIFHTVMGHDKNALSCVGFMTTFIRGCEWAAKKKVTFQVPEDFPTEYETSKRDY